MKILKTICFIICALIALFICIYAVNILIHSVFISCFDFQLIVFLIISVVVAICPLLFCAKINLYTKGIVLIIVAILLAANYINIAEKIPVVKNVSDAIRCTDMGGVWNKDINFCSTDDK